MFPDKLIELLAVGVIFAWRSAAPGVAVNPRAVRTRPAKQRPQIVGNPGEDKAAESREIGGIFPIELLLDRLKHQIRIGRKTSDPFDPAKSATRFA